MGNTCSAVAPVLPTRPRYTLVYSPLAEDCVGSLARWVQLVNTHHARANFNALNIVNASSSRGLNILPAVDPRKLPVIFAVIGGKAPALIPFDQIGSVELELERLHNVAIISGDGGGEGGH